VKVSKKMPIAILTLIFNMPDHCGIQADNSLPEDRKNPSGKCKSKDLPVRCEAHERTDTFNRIAKK